MGKRKRVPTRVPLHRRLLRGAGTIGLIVACVGLPWWLSRALPTDGAAATPGESRPVVVAPALARVAVDSVRAVAEVAVPPLEYLEGELASAGRPVRLLVPRLGVDASVQPISGQSGELVPPADPQVLGWWQEGARPGSAEGTTVVTGHTVHTGGGALDALGTLRRGDRFTIRTDRGTIRYVVRWQHDYPTAELARRSPKLFEQDDFHRLLLITCSGWNGQGYDNSAVVLARPIEELPG